MQILMITQKVDRKDGILGVYHEWIRELAKKVDNLYVICLEKGRVELPAAVKVMSLGKEKGERGIFVKAIYGWRFFRYLSRIEGKYGSVLVHMNPEYLLLAGWWWRFRGRRVVFWYNHPRGGWRARVAAWWSQAVLYTSTYAWAARLKKKARRMPVGVKIETEARRKTERTEEFRILYAGRVAPIKKVEEIVEAVADLAGGRVDFRLTIVGEADGESGWYKERVKNKIKAAGIEGRVKWLGEVPNYKMDEVYAEQDVLVNLTPEGSLDKVMFEAMAAGVPVITSNLGVWEQWPREWREKLGTEAEPKVVAEKIEKLSRWRREEREKIGQALKKWVAEHHSLERTMEEMIKILR